MRQNYTRKFIWGISTNRTKKDIGRVCLCRWVARLTGLAIGAVVRRGGGTGVHEYGGMVRVKENGQDKQKGKREAVSLQEAMVHNETTGEDGCARQ